MLNDLLQVKMSLQLKGQQLYVVRVNLLQKCCMFFRTQIICLDMLLGDVLSSLEIICIELLCQLGI